MRTRSADSTGCYIPASLQETGFPWLFPMMKVIEGWAREGGRGRLGRLESTQQHHSSWNSETVGQIPTVLQVGKELLGSITSCRARGLEPSYAANARSGGNQVVRGGSARHAGQRSAINDAECNRVNRARIRGRTGKTNDRIAFR